MCCYQIKNPHLGQQQVEFLFQHNFSSLKKRESSLKLCRTIQEAKRKGGEQLKWIRLWAFYCLYNNTNYKEKDIEYWWSPTGVLIKCSQMGHLCALSCSGQFKVTPTTQDTRFSMRGCTDSCAGLLSCFHPSHSLTRVTWTLFLALILKY